MFGAKETSVDITGLDKKEVLVALYNASEPDGYGAINADRRQMSLKRAEKFFESGGSLQFIDHLNAKPLKITLALESETSIRTTIYNRDNPIKAEDIIENLRKLQEGKLKKDEIPEYLQSIIDSKKPQPPLEKLKSFFGQGRYY